MRHLTFLLLLLTSCSSNPWSYNTPPGHGAMDREVLHKPVILLDQFTAGTGVNDRWSNVAPQMRRAFARAIIKSGKFEVVMDDALSGDALQAINTHGVDRGSSLAAVRESLGSVTAFLVSARVTDFLHTDDAPESVQKLHWFTKGNDALVAIDLTATDLQDGRTVITDQFAATVAAGDDEADQYGDLEFGSYLFWSTPLGRASSDVIDKVIHQLSKLQTASPGGSNITARLKEGRKVTLSNGSLLDDGGIYYVIEMDNASGKYRSIDDDLGKPLRLRVEKNMLGKSSGWLLSEPASYEQVVGATLSKTLLEALATPSR